MLYNTIDNTLTHKGYQSTYHSLRGDNKLHCGHSCFKKNKYFTMLCVLLAKVNDKDYNAI